MARLPALARGHALLGGEEPDPPRLRGERVQRGTERELLAEDGPFRRLARDLRGSVTSAELARNL